MTSAEKPEAPEAGTMTEFGLLDPSYVRKILDLWQTGLPGIDATGIPMFVIANAVMLRFKAWQAEMFSTYGINLSDFQILSTLYLSPTGALTPSELRTTLWLTPGGVTRTIKRLHDLKLVEYRQSTTDKRTNPVRLTAPGKRKAREICEKVAAFYRTAIADLSPANQKKIIDGMLLFLREVDIG